MADKDTGVVGAPLPEQTVDMLPTLNGMGESVVVTIHNPLSSDFRVQYARSVVQGAQLSKEQQFAREKAGLDLTKEQSPQAHSVKYLVLKSGESINLPGDIAQIAVRQLVNYMIQARHKGQASMPLADAHARNSVEQEVIVTIKDNLTFFNPETPEEATDAEIAKLNTQPVKVGVESEKTDPPPGQGMSYEPKSPSPKAA